MKGKISFCLVLLLSGLNSFAQRELKNPLINSKDVIATGAALHDKKEYKAAIAEYMKVPVSDTNYSSVLHELYLSSYADSNYAAAEKYVLTAIDLYPEKNNQWLMMLADIYDDTKRSDKALAIYDSVLINNKYDYLSYFNRGISHLRAEDYDASMADLKKCVTLNPYYSSAHYFLGLCTLLKGNMVQAMLSFSTYLLIAPEGKYKNKTISFLNTIAEQNSTAEEFLKSYKPGKEDDFEAVQDIITSKIALDKKYKLQADFDDKIVRQLQVMMEKLEYNANDKGFWMQYYVPLYKKLWDNKNFEPFVFYIFSGVDFKDIKTYIKNNKKDLEKMYKDAIAYFNDIRETQELNYNARGSAKIKYYVKDYNIIGKGESKLNDKNEAVFFGPWEFYYTTGNLKSKGVLNENNLRKGEWRYYYESGLLKESTFYTDGKANGKAESWYDNGVKATSSNYRDDMLNGIETTWYYNGLIRSAVNYNMGKKEGKAKYYNSNGLLATLSNYSNDMYEGEEITYYESGKTASKGNYIKDKADGVYTEYHENGKVKRTGSFADGKLTGEWKWFYDNGQPEYVQNYSKGELNGDYISYYDNGKTEMRSVYSKGEADGKSQHFDDDGILYKETVFEKGRLRDIKFYDKKGQVISSTSSRKGDAAITFYKPDGSKSEDGTYTKDGLQEGKGVYYFRNGKPSSESFYKKGLLEGKRTFYYSNGKLSQEGFYTNDKPNGYFVNYYNNGVVSNEGWYVNGDKQGTFLYYNPQGNLVTRTYYLNDKASGIQESFHPNGKPDYTEYYDTDWFKKIVQFDTTGKVLSTSVLDKGEGKMIFLHYDGKPYIESHYKNYVRNGMYKIINDDGSVASISYYKNGKPDSIYKSWYPNGKLQMEGVYMNGDKTGVWKSYWRNGQLRESETFEEDKLNGKNSYYNEDGSLEKEITYKKNTLNGEFRIYAENKALAAVVYYKDNIVTGYSYEDKNGTLVPMIALPKGQGNMAAYFKNGNKSVYMQFDESYNEGDRILYYTTGKERVVGKRVNGQDNGVKKIYYPSGKLMKEENYVEGNLHGNSKFYAENGSLIYDVNYFNDNLHGTCKYYENGKLTETLVYYYAALEAKK